MFLLSNAFEINVGCVCAGNVTGDSRLQGHYDFNIRFKETEWVREGNIEDRIFKSQWNLLLNISLDIYKHVCKCTRLQ